MFGTALTFHIVSIFEEAGRSREEAFFYFVPAAVFSTLVNLSASTIVDRYPLRPFQITLLIAFTVGAFGLLNLDTEWGFWLLAGGFGTGGGLWGVISSLAFIRFYGPLHLGEISGFNTSVTVFASAIGPAAFSLALDSFGYYGAAVKICMVALIVLLISTILSKGFCHSNIVLHNLADFQFKVLIIKQVYITFATFSVFFHLIVLNHYPHNDQSSSRKG